MGKWSKKARERHSVRMKERFKAKMESGQISPINNKSLTIKDRLNIIETQVQAIRKELGQ